MEVVDGQANASKEVPFASYHTFVHTAPRRSRFRPKAGRRGDFPTRYTGRRFTRGTYVSGGSFETVDSFHDDAGGVLPQPWTGETLLEVVDEVNDLDRRPRMKGDAWVAETTSLRRVHHRHRHELYEPDFPGADQALERFRVTICTYDDGTSETIVDDWLASRDGGRPASVGGPGALPQVGGALPHPPPTLCRRVREPGGQATLCFLSLIHI